MVGRNTTPKMASERMNSSLRPKQMLLSEYPFLEEIVISSHL